MTTETQFEPTIIGFTCNWCSYRAADLAGTARVKYPSNIRLLRLMCSGRLDPTFVFKALAGGADGVLITGCHPGECHYIEQNYKALRRFLLMRRVLEQMGIERGRVRLVWASAAEGVKLAEEFTKMIEEVRALGPLNWGKDQYSVSSRQFSVGSSQAEEKLNTAHWTLTTEAEEVPA